MAVVRAIYDYAAQEPAELSFLTDQLLVVVDDVSDPDWWQAYITHKPNAAGSIPSNYVEKVCSLTIILIFKGHT